MLRSKSEISKDFNNASKRMKPFYQNCILAIENYSEAELKQVLDKQIAIIKIYIARRKNTKDKTLYKEELKTARKYQRWLKYLLILPKKPYSRLKRKGKSISSRRKAKA